MIASLIFNPSRKSVRFDHSPTALLAQYFPFFLSRWNPHFWRKNSLQSPNETNDLRTLDSGSSITPQANVYVCSSATFLILNSYSPATVSVVFAKILQQKPSSLTNEKCLEIEWDVFSFFLGFWFLIICYAVDKPANNTYLRREWRLYLGQLMALFVGGWCIIIDDDGSE